MQNPSTGREQQLRVLSIICFGILMGVVMFAGVVWYLVNPGGISLGEGFPTYLSTLLNLAALVLLLIAHLIPKLVKAPGGDAPEESQLAWFTRVTIIAFAVREVAAFIALVGVLLTGQQIRGFVVAGLAVAAMIYAWPRASRAQPVL
jgi:hypothetical protein